MALPQGVATFPGVLSLVDASYSLTHGISPGIATITMTPQAGFTAAGGTLAFYFGSTRITFPDCKVDQHSFRRTRQGLIWQLSIFDRRWKWVAGPGRISGHYNLRKDDGILRTGTEKTPQELATLLLDAMGESGYSVGSLPNFARPDVHWEDASPPQELATLCDSLGCRIVLQLTNRVALLPQGHGAALPPGFILEDSLTIDPPEKPDKLTIACGPTRYQVDLDLEAVGRDNDDEGTVKLIDDLDYIPAGGWVGQDPPAFSGVAGEETRADGTKVLNQKVAAQTIFRMYRVAFPVMVPGYPRLLYDLDHLEIELAQVDTKTENGIEVNLSAEVWGDWCPGPDEYTNKTDTIVNVNWSWDAAHGIVRFSEAVFKTNVAGQLSAIPAVLKLRAAVRVRKDTDHSYLNYVSWRTLGNWGTQEHVTHHDELHLCYKNGKRENQAEIDTICRYYLDGIEAQFHKPLPQTRTYDRIMAITPDGAIHQVTWNVGGRGATTIASRNNEQLERVIPYKERRMLQTVQDDDKVVKRVWHERGRKDATRR